MITVVRTKPGVEFKVIAAAGFRILRAIDEAAETLRHDITITSACDGEHSGPEDPHHKGEAYDVRTHDIPDKHMLLSVIQQVLGVEYFYAFIEDPDSPNEHIHVQRKKDTIYPPAD